VLEYISISLSFWVELVGVCNSTLRVQFPIDGLCCWICYLLEFVTARFAVFCTSKKDVNDQLLYSIGWLNIVRKTPLVP
jgi:hypothetical protein